jgi:hypothetical protein
MEGSSHHNGGPGNTLATTPSDSVSPRTESRKFSGQLMCRAKKVNSLKKVVISRRNTPQKILSIADPLILDKYCNKFSTLLISCGY